MQLKFIRSFRTDSGIEQRLQKNVPLAVASDDGQLAPAAGFSEQDVAVAAELLDELARERVSGALSRLDDSLANIF